MENKPTILYEDNHVIVAVKPPNLLTQGDDTGDANLLDQIKEYLGLDMVLTQRVVLPSMIDLTVAQ